MHRGFPSSLQLFQESCNVADLHIDDANSASTSIYLFGPHYGKIVMDTFYYSFYRIYLEYSADTPDYIFFHIDFLTSGIHCSQYYFILFSI